MKRIFINTMLVLFCLLATIALGKDSRYNTENIPKLTIEDIESIEDEEALFFIGLILETDEIPDYSGEGPLISYPEKALMVYREILKRGGKKEAAARICISRVLIRLGRYDEAINELTDRRTNKCMHVSSAYVLRGDIEMAKNNIHEALHYYHEAWKKDYLHYELNLRLIFLRDIGILGEGKEFNKYGLPYSSEMMNRSFSERCIVFSSIERDLWDYEEKYNTAFMTNALEFARRGVPSAMKLLYIGYKDGTNSILPNELQALKWKGRYETATGTTLD